jgi:hypothetical protein
MTTMKIAYALLAAVMIMIAGSRQARPADEYCVCPQYDLWHVDSSTWAYWAFGYSYVTGDMDCTDDPVDAILYYGAANYMPLPAAYCANPGDPGERCNDCIQQGDGVAHKPEASFTPLAPAAPHGLPGTWTELKVTFVKFKPADKEAWRFAKLFLLQSSDKTIVGFGFEITSDPGKITKSVLPNKCQLVEHRFHDDAGKLQKGMSKTVRKFELPDAFYTVRVAK